MSDNKKFSAIYADVLSAVPMFAAQIILALLEELDVDQRAKVLDSVTEFVNLE